MVTISRWNVLEYLDSEEEITGFLEAVMEEGGISAMPRALAKAAQARTINQLAKETGIDRKILCEMFLEDSNTGKALKLNQEVVVKVAKAFSVPVHV